MNESIKHNLFCSITLAIIIYIFVIIIMLCFQHFRKDYSNWLELDATVIDTWFEAMERFNGIRKNNYWTKFEYEIDNIIYKNETKGYIFMVVIMMAQTM